jgi:hypothetical protein
MDIRNLYNSKITTSANKYMFYIIIFILVMIFMVAGSIFYVLGIYALFLYCKKNTVSIVLPEAILNKIGK